MKQRFNASKRSRKVWDFLTEFATTYIIVYRKSPHSSPTCRCIHIYLNLNIERAVTRRTSSVPHSPASIPLATIPTGSKTVRNGLEIWRQTTRHGLYTNPSMVKNRRLLLKTNLRLKNGRSMNPKSSAVVDLRTNGVR